MQPKLQKRIQKQQPTSQPQVILQPAIKPLDEKPLVEAFDQNQINQMTILNEQNNMYGSIRQQEEQIKVQVRTLKKIIHDVRSGKTRMNTLHIPYGMPGGSKNLTEQDKQEYLDMFMKQLVVEENKLKALSGQRLHRGDELGEQRMKILRMFTDILVHQHKFTEEELFNQCKEYNEARKNPYDLQMQRSPDDINAVLQKAGLNPLPSRVEQRKQMREAKQLVTT